VAPFTAALSDEVVDLCLALDRILTQPGGSTLIAGRYGMGRADCARLIGHMHQMQLVELRISPSYTVKSFGKDLKQAMQAAGVDGEQVLLVVEDHQLLEEAFLQQLNSLVSSGSVPGLFSQSEFDQFIAPLRASAGQGEEMGGDIQQLFAKRKQWLDMQDLKSHF